jgi:hypothetical protein
MADSAKAREIAMIACQAIALVAIDLVAPRLDVADEGARLEHVGEQHPSGHLGP